MINLEKYRLLEEYFGEPVGGGWTFLQENDIITERTVKLFITALIAETSTSFAINPPGVIATEFFNQGLDERDRRIYYNGMMDCILKILDLKEFTEFTKTFGQTIYE